MKLTKIALAVALLGTAAHVAAADEQKVQKIEVTGSNIKRTATETASPIQVIRAEEIRKSGVTTVAELLKLVPALSSGGLDNLGGGSGFSSGASSASLRGLGSSSTLVLLNGRRMSPAAYADPNSGQSTIYNLNNIPLSAIERVEVVKDGASAVYGSDAIAGVVNFILRNDFEGAQLTVNGGKSLNGGFGNYSANGVIGKGDINKDRYNVMLAADVKHRDSARLDEADAIARDAYLRINNRLNPTFNATGTPASYYKERTPGSGAFTVLVGADSRCPASKLNAAGNCTWDQWAPLVAVAKSDEASLFSHGSLNINDNLSAFAEASFTESKATYPLNPVGVTQNPTTWFSTDGVRQSFLIVLAANHPDNPLFKANPNNTQKVVARYRFADLPREDVVTLKSWQTVLGLKGSNFGWDWQSGILFGKSERTTVGHGYVLAKEASDAINDLSYRPGGSNNAAVLAKISPEQNNHGETTLTSADLRGSTEFGELAGGAIGLAVGVEARRESIKIDPDSHLKRAEWVGLGSSSADGSRNVQSMFGELRLPVLKTLEAEAAVRFDHYSDYGNSTTPKVGLKWTPNSTIALRSTYSEGFRAPGLTQISKSSVQSFNTITDRLRCAGNVDPKTLDGTECTSGRSISSQIQANPNLNPERSKSYTLGLVFSPTNNFSSTVDYYEIRRRDEIDRVGSQYIIDQTYLNGDQRFVNQIFRNPLQDTWVRDKSGNLIPNSGPIVSTVRKFFNLGESRLKGVDLSVTLKNSLGEYGKLSSTFDGSYMLSYKQYTFPGDPFRDYAGASGPNGALPRLKASMASTWSKGPYNVTGRVNFTDGWYNSDSFLNCATTTNPAYTAEFPNCRVSSWTTFDLNVGYTGIKNLTLSATVRNLFNREAPYDDSSTAIINQGYNDGFHNPYGRYLNVSASYKFY